MSKRTAAQAFSDEPTTSASTSSREMQGSGADGKKHSIDSDEEEEYEKAQQNYELMNDDDIEGQEDETIERDGEIQITPFNLKEEQEEGHFAADGNFIWNKAEKEVKDAWLDDIDWVKVKETQQAEIQRREEADEKEDEAAAAYNELSSYKDILTLLKPGETVAKAIRRLAGGDVGKKRQQAQRKLQQKIKKGQSLTAEEEQLKSDNEAMSKLTGFADLVLSRSGNMGIYEETFEKISYRVKQAEVKKKTLIPEGIDDDDALDMFADNFDDDKAAKKDQERKAEEEKAKEEEEQMNLDDVIKWEFRWENKDDAEIHGPHTSEEMLKWQDSGYFKKGVFVRRVGRAGSDFVDARRVDFDLYT